MDFKLRIGELMNERGLSLADVCRLCPTVDKATLSRILREQRDPRLSTVCALAVGLGVPFSELVVVNA